MPAALRSGSLVAGVERCGIDFICMITMDFFCLLRSKLRIYGEREESGAKSERKICTLVAGVECCRIYFIWLAVMNLGVLKGAAFH